MNTMIQDYVLGFVFDLYNHKVLLIKKKKPEWQKGFFNGIGGKVEKEDVIPLAAMLRECWEETGVHTDSQKWFSFCKMKGRNCPDGDWNVYCLYYVLKGIDDRYEYRTNEEEAVMWIPLSEIKANEKLLGNIPWLVGLALDHYINGNFAPVEVEYTGGFSLPLNLI